MQGDSHRFYDMEKIMKKVFMLCGVLLVFITSIAFGDSRVLGERLEVTVVTREASYVRPRYIEMTIINARTKKMINIWVEHVIEGIYDIKRRPDGLHLGQAILLGTAGIYSRDFLPLIIKQCNRLAMEDEGVWREQADAIAQFFSEYIIKDIQNRKR